MNMRLVEFTIACSGKRALINPDHVALVIEGDRTAELFFPCASDVMESAVVMGSYDEVVAKLRGAK